MSYSEILKSISEQKLKNLYLFYGREVYLVEKAVENLKLNLNEGMADFNFTVIDGRETSYEKCLSAIETLPFMDDFRVVCIKEFELLKKKKNFSQQEETLFLELLTKLPETTILVMSISENVDKKKIIYKNIKKYGQICECNKLSDMDLLKLARGIFEKKDVAIENSEVLYFLDSTGYRDRNSELTLNDVKNEIDKLIAYVGSEKKITKSVIDELSRNRIENDIFKLIDFINTKNSKKAMKILNDMLNDGESILGIFAMMHKQIKLLMQVKTLQNKGLNNNKIVSDLKIRQFMANKLIKQVKYYDINSLIKMGNYISESDYNIKNGLIKDNLAIEILVAQFC